MRTATLLIEDGTVRASLDELEASGDFDTLLTGRTEAALARSVESTTRVRFGPDQISWQADVEAVAVAGDQLASGLRRDPALAEVVHRLTQQPPERLRIESADPEPLALPWELLPSADGSVIAEHGQILRVPLVTFTPSREDGLPAPESAALRIVVVSPRPSGRADVSRQPTLGPTIAAALSHPNAVELTLVRPPTFDALRRVIEEQGPFDVVHFDGHGVTVERGDVTLAFQDAGGGADLISGADFARVVKRAAPSVVLINACRSAYVRPEAAPTPSLAARVCAAVPRARVVAMRYAVSVDLVESLVSTFYPQLLSGASVEEAVSASNRHLVADWRARPAQTGPLFVNLTVWGAAGEGERRLPHRASSTAVDWRAAGEALFWSDELEELHSALDAQRVVVTRSTLTSATPDVLTVFADYAVATGAFERWRRLPADGAGVEDGTLYLSRYGPAEDAAGAVRAWRSIVGQEGASAAVVERIDGRPRPGTEDEVSVGAFTVPTDLISTRLRDLIGAHLLPEEDAVENAHALAILLACQDDYLALGHFSSCTSFADALDAVERLRWGHRLDGFPRAEMLRAALMQLSDRQRTLISLFGACEGPLYSEYLTLVTSGGIFNETFRDLVGYHAAAEDWTDALQAAARCGLVGLVRGWASQPAAWVTPVLSLACRECLVGWAGSDGLDALRRAFAEGAFAFTTHFASVFRQGTPEIYDNFIAVTEPQLTRALELGLRFEDDDLASTALHLILSRREHGSQVFRQSISGCEAIAARYDIGSLPEFQALLLAWRASDTIEREMWQAALVQAERALAVSGARWSYMPKVNVRIMRSRALWRLGRTAEAEAELALAGADGGPAAEEVIADACEDLAQYLVLTNAGKEQLRERIGCAPPPVSELRQAIAAEKAGRLGEAHNHFIANLREAQSRNRSTQIALAMHELGRFAAMYGSHEEATYWLTQDLSLGVGLELDPASALRLLGLSAERAEEFEEAAHWLPTPPRRPGGATTSADTPRCSTSSRSCISRPRRTWRTAARSFSRRLPSSIASVRQHMPAIAG